MNKVTILVGDALNKIGHNDAKPISDLTMAHSVALDLVKVTAFTFGNLASFD